MIKPNIHSKILTVLHHLKKEWAFFHQNWTKNCVLLLWTFVPSISIAWAIVHWLARVKNLSANKSMLVLLEMLMMTIASLWICGDALVTRWHNPQHPPTSTPDSYVITQGTLKGPWKGDFEEVEKMYSFATPNWETERERGGKRRAGQTCFNPILWGAVFARRPIRAL